MELLVFKLIQFAHLNKNGIEICIFFIFYRNKSKANKWKGWDDSDPIVLFFVHFKYIWNRTCGMWLCVCVFACALIKCKNEHGLGTWIPIQKCVINDFSTVTHEQHNSKTPHLIHHRFIMPNVSDFVHEKNEYNNNNSNGNNVKLHSHIFDIYSTHAFYAIRINNPTTKKNQL